MRGAARQRGCWPNGPTPDLLYRNGTGSSSSAPPALDYPAISLLILCLQTLSKSAQVPAGTAFLNAPRAPCAISPEAAHSPRPPTRSCALLGAAFASRPSETQVREAQEQPRSGTQSFMLGRYAASQLMRHDLKPCLGSQRYHLFSANHRA